MSMRLSQKGLSGTARDMTKYDTPVRIHEDLSLFPGIAAPVSATPATPGLASQASFFNPASSSIGNPAAPLPTTPFRPESPAERAIMNAAERRTLRSGKNLFR
eukprot:comp26611_c0_seq1/m.62311 comp26611_c0_seq1/g.62311  ORF comp26611_c0_seq1/g.62311 comp26611_c0_seq1/m.62311 type:complete len:103 (-) comp26611_c0_seq1:96-404(-)